MAMIRPAPVNLTAQNTTTPDSEALDVVPSKSGSGNGKGKGGNGTMDVEESVVGAAFGGASGLNGLTDFFF
jgi:hypothetical protein